MQTNESLRLALQTPAGEQLKAFLVEKLAELGSLSSVREFENPEAQALEVKAQKKCYEYMAKLYRDLLDTSENDIITSDEYNPD